MSKAIKTVTKTGRRAKIDFVRGVNSYGTRCVLTVYESASNAKLVKFRGVWMQLKGSPSRHGYILDLSKPYKWPTRARKTDTQKSIEQKNAYKEALKRAKAVLSRSDLKILGLSK